MLLESNVFMIPSDFVYKPTCDRCYSLRVVFKGVDRRKSKFSCLNCRRRFVCASKLVCFVQVYYTVPASTGKNTFSNFNRRSNHRSNCLCDFCNLKPIPSVLRQR